MDSATYLDLHHGEQETLFFFLLNAYLQSRIDTDNETDGDEEVNVYLAGLLHDIVDGRFYSDNVERLATSSLDVCQLADACGTPRGKTQVYRTNADHRLLAFGLFAGWGEQTSLYRRTQTPDAAHAEAAQQFYAWAALFCARLPERYRGLATTLEKLADGFETYHAVLIHMAGHHLGLMERLSPGQTWHLEREAHRAALPQIEEHALDRMLDAYNRWRLDPKADTRQRFLEESAPYCQLRPEVDPGELLN